MARELNEHLFASVEPTISPPLVSTSTIPTQPHAEASLFEAFRRKVKEVEARFDNLQSRLGDFSGQIKLRFERIQNQFTRGDEVFQAFQKDVHDKLAQLTSRVNERKLADAKIHELVERHSQIVQGFETRLASLQKVISEQELQLMNSRTELKEAQRELARLKKL